MNLVMMIVMGMMMRVLNDGDDNADEGDDNGDVDDDNVTRVHERRSSSVVNLVIMVLVVMRLRSLIMPMRDWGGDGDVACLGDKIQTGSAMLL